MKMGKKIEGITVHIDEETAHQLLADTLINVLPAVYFRPVVIVCIGTDRSTGDSLGPLVGSFLSDAGLDEFHVYGTLEKPVHAMNLRDTLEHIKLTYRNPFIIGIDACLGKAASIGEIKVGKGPVKPGAGVRKSLPEVGEASITGIVNVAGHMEFIVLQNTRLHLVMRLAKQIAEAIIEADRFTAKRHSLPPFTAHLSGNKKNSQACEFSFSR